MKDLTCRACGRALELGEPMYEVACSYFYCTGCCQPGVATEFPIVGDRVLRPTPNGYENT